MFPPRNVLKNLPPVFKHFKNVRCVIDCTEFFCHVPRNYRHQGNVFSANKHYTTLKALIAVAPNGTAIFISDLFEGSTDDVTITEKSGFLDHIEPGDLILADKGFEIEELLLCKGAHSKLPAKLNGRAKLTKGEELETRRIAKARIHIERFNERLNKRRPYDSPDPPHRSIFHTPWCKRRTNTPASRSPSPTLHSITSPRLAAASAEFRHIPPLILASTQTPASSSLAAAPPKQWCSGDKFRRLERDYERLERDFDEWERLASAAEGVCVRYLLARRATLGDLGNKQVEDFLGEVGDVDGDKYFKHKLI